MLSLCDLLEIVIIQEQQQIDDTLTSKKKTFHFSQQLASLPLFLKPHLEFYHHSSLKPDGSTTPFWFEILGMQHIPAWYGGDDLSYIYLFTLYYFPDRILGMDSTSWICCQSLKEKESHFLYSLYKILCGWLNCADPEIRSVVVCAGGRWTKPINYIQNQPPFYCIILESIIYEQAKI